MIPPEVRRAGQRFDPKRYEHWGIKPSELKKGAALVKHALDELGEPQIYVNRSLEDGLRLLRQGGQFSTLHDLKKPDEEVAAYMEGRTAHEKRLDTLGEGPLEGRTVYGSLGFSKELSPEGWEDGYLHDPQKPPQTHLNSGIELTAGAVTFVLKPEANQHSTFLSTDTYDAHGEMPVDREHLPFAIWANLGSKGDSYFTADEGSQCLLRLPHARAVHVVERFLTSDAINRGYMEAQVRGASLDEVERIVVRPKYAQNPEDLQEFQRLAEERGLPCEVARDQAH